MRIGDRADNVTNANAKFDNVRIWSVVRTASEISSNKDICLTGSETGLDILYNMEEGSGTVLNDLATGNGAQNGTIVGTVSWGTGAACCTSSITSSVSSQTNVICNAASTGSATVSPSGGTGSYTYSWAPSGGTGATASSLSAGTYTCTINDGVSCAATKTVTITQPAALTGTDVKSACTSYTWINGTTYTSNNNTATHTLTNATGCDSVVTLNLTIGIIPVSINASPTAVCT
ncbi:MAG: SprB repeat-containing protein, partial [Bacteroidetes bacterium]|nr:SprB repeat-containing protein [Bacteroidota bacterium]